MAKIHDAEATYKRWWVGKRCRPAGQPHHKFKRVVDVRVIGPRSYVYGEAELIFEDGSRDFVYHGDAFKPRKSDIEVAAD